MTDSSSDIRRVRQLVEEVKAARVPPIQWAALEQELFSELEGQAPSASGLAPRRSGFPQSGLAWGLAAAAGAVLALGGYRVLNNHHQDLPSQAGTASARTWTSPNVDNAQTKVGDRFVASHSDITITDARLGKWVLSSGGEATLLRRDPLVMQLAQGELLAEITPGLGPDIFAVEAAQTRVAVKGTVFRVRRSLDHVHVDLMRGEVAVSSLGAGRQIFPLRAPASGDFALDASSGQVWEPSGTLVGAKAASPNELARANETRGAANLESTDPRSAVEASPPKKLSSKLTRAPEQDTAIPAEIPLTLNLSQANAGVDALVRSARDCLYSNVAKNGHPLSSKFTTQARLQVNSKGDLTELEFAPPFLPQADACLRRQIQTLNFGESQKGAELFRRLEIDLSPR
ncbi:MAG: FecR domain-containing protein [Polyangiaceae bacterium]|nr:FecR domain-containing protein [Polyangiaceae bacterium]